MYCKILLASLILSELSIFQLAAQSGKISKFSATSGELIGLWSGEGEVIEFRSDGICLYGGESFEYQVSNGYLVIFKQSGKISFSCKLGSDKLTLTADGHQSSYLKMTSLDKVTPRLNDIRNPVDISGKWCYLKNSSGAFTGRCITLRDNGTYLFGFDGPDKVDLQSTGARMTADSGIWYVDEERLFYQSAIRGGGSYKLERRNGPSNPSNPVIVLDSEPFVKTGQPR